MNRIFVVQSFNLSTFTLNPCVIAFSTQVEAEECISYYNKNYGPSIKYSYQVVTLGKWNMKTNLVQITGKLVKIKDAKKGKPLSKVFKDEEKTERRKKIIRSLNAKLTDNYYYPFGPQKGK